jgi:hypothetical protein
MHVTYLRFTPRFRPCFMRRQQAGPTRMPVWVSTHERKTANGFRCCQWPSRHTDGRTDGQNEQAGVLS